MPNASSFYQFGQAALDWSGNHPLDLVGLLGALLILFAFYRTSIGRWTGRSFWYEFDNLLGSICLIFYSYYKGSYITLVLNFVWLAVAFRGLTSIHERKVVRSKSRRRRQRHVSRRIA